MSERPYLVLVGGFLGAGKTTLILAAARELARRGLRSAAILNDQGASLVDTQLARGAGLAAGEVTGGCFCCRFSELMEIAAQLREHHPDVIFAEPVGSCTDISATTLQPIHAAYSGEYRLAPFTVLVDPARAADLEGAGADQDMEFLFTRQLAEADLIAVTKSDLYPEGSLPSLPGARRLSAKTGEGIAAWLDEVLSGTLRAGSRVLDIDYERYAQAEAAFAWLNLEARISCDPPLSPAMLLGPIFDDIDEGLSAAGVAIVHLKASDSTAAGFLKAATCANRREPEVEGALDASPATRHELLVNLRAAGDPAVVRPIVERALLRSGSIIEQLQLDCFRPAPPRPERRMPLLSPQP